MSLTTLPDPFLPPISMPDGVAAWPILDLATEGSQAAYTDTDRARLLLNHIRTTGRDVLYCQGRGFFVYSDGVWTADERDYLRTASHALGDEIAEAATQEFAKVAGQSSKEAIEGQQRRAAAVMGASFKFKRGGDIDGCLREMRALAEIRKVSSDDLDRDPDLLAVANGIIDLRTGALHGANTHELITQRLPLSYDADALCPRWEAFLRDVIVTEDGQPDLAVIEYLQRLVGYGITGHTSEQVFAVLHGNGANGKGVFTETLAHVFGAIARTTGFETFEAKSQSGAGDSASVARLAGARLVFASEGERSKPLSAALIKRLTGQDTIAARHLYQNTFEFTPRFLVVLSTNHRPAINDSSEGYWRRVKMIPFRRFFTESERDRGLHDALREEAEGILRWAVEGAMKWHRDGLTTPEAVERETRLYRDSQDRLAEFLSTRLAITGQRSDVATVKQVWLAYKEWADDEAEEHPLRRNTLVQSVGARQGVLQRTVANQAVLTGLRLLTDAERRTATADAARALGAHTEVDDLRNGENGKSDSSSGTSLKESIIGEVQETGSDFPFSLPSSHLMGAF
jgi:putative DNA primase/helicase